MEGWAWHTSLYANPGAIQQRICVEDSGGRPGRVEFDDASPPGKAYLYCEFQREDGSWYTFFDPWEIDWGVACQQGYSEVDVDLSGPRPVIGSCVKSIGEIPGHPEVCCDTVGNPIYLTSRRKVQREVDYVGSGAFPLRFERIYSSGKAGVALLSLNDASVRVWRHNYDKYLAGDLTGTNAISNVQIYTRVGFQWFPQPPTSGGAVGNDYNAFRPDGSSYYFIDLTTAPTQRTSLRRATTPQGEPGFLLQLASDEQEYYNENGQLVAVRNRAGQTHWLTYDGRVLQSVMDDDGRALQFEYNEDGQLAAVIDPAGQRIEYTYIGHDDVETVTYPDTGNGRSTKTYVYDGAARYLTGIINERGHRYVSWTYDHSNNNTRGFATGSTGPAGEGAVQLGQFGTQGNVRVTNALGLNEWYSFSVVEGSKVITSHWREATAGVPAATTYRTYDAAGFLASRTDWEGNVTSWTRDERGLPLTETFAAGTPVERTVTRTWHPEFRIPVQENYPDYTVDYTHDARGNVLTRTLTDNITGAQRTWRYSYNALGKVLSEDGPRTDVADVTTYTYYGCTTGGACGQLQTVTNAAGHTTTVTAYNAHGQPLSITDPNGVITTLTYDARLRLTSRTTDGQSTTISYDDAGNIIRVTLPDGTYTDYSWDQTNRLIAVADAENNRIEWTLDNAGNRTDEVFRDPTNTVTKTQGRVYDALSRMISLVPAHGNASSYGYDDNSNQTTMTDAASRTTSQSFDALDRLVTLQDALAGITTYAYDTQDNIVGVTDPENETTTYTYNGFGDQQTVNSPDTGLTTYTVDEAGNRSSETDARGVTVNYAYDALNRLTTVAYPDSSLNITYHYDQGANGTGRLTGVTDESGTTDYRYDGRGNLVEVNHTIAGHSYTQTYSYNGADRPTGMTLPSGRAVTYSYDASGRISDVSSNGTEALASGITRLPFGPSQTMTLGNGIARSRSYDLDYRIQSINDAGALSRNYAIDAVDNITAITDGLNPAVSQLFTYDALDRLDFATGNYGDKSYSYDGVGNRLSLTTDQSEQGGAVTTQTYDYSTVGHRLDAILGERSFQYDAAGNTLDNGQASFSYNDRNRMASSIANGLSTTYRYNAMGQRVEKVNSNGTIHYIFDLAGRLIAETDGTTGTIAVEYTYLDGEPLAMWREDAPSVPGPVTPIAPIGSTDTATPTYSWEVVDTAIEYRLKIIDSATGTVISNEKHDAATICGTGICSVLPQGISLNFAKNHRWRVRARSEAGWNAWTDKIHFDYLDIPPATITAIAPVASTDTATPSFEWEDVGNAETYQLKIKDKSLPEVIHNESYLAVDICSSGICSVTPAISLNFHTNHHWRVRGQNTGGWGEWSEKEFFDYLDTPPGVVTPGNPTGVITESTPTYEWAPLPSATEYQIKVIDRDTTTVLYNAAHEASVVCDSSLCSLIPPDITLTAGTRYRWRIRAGNSGGWGTWSANQSFELSGGQ